MPQEALTAKMQNALRAVLSRELSFDLFSQRSRQEERSRARLTSAAFAHRPGSSAG